MYVLPTPTGFTVIIYFTMDIQLYIGISYYMNRYVTRVGDLECFMFTNMRYFYRVMRLSLSHN